MCLHQILVSSHPSQGSRPGHMAQVSETLNSKKPKSVAKSGRNPKIGAYDRKMVSDMFASHRRSMGGKAPIRCGRESLHPGANRWTSARPWCQPVDECTSLGVNQWTSARPWCQPVDECTSLVSTGARVHAHGFNRCQLAPRTPPSDRTGGDQPRNRVVAEQVEVESKVSKAIDNIQTPSAATRGQPGFNLGSTCTASPSAPRTSLGVTKLIEKRPPTAWGKQISCVSEGER